MPELPEVETVRRGLEPALTGRRIARVELRRPDLRIPLPKDFARRLEGRRILGLSRRAKYLLAALDSGETLIIHLGMSGQLTLRHASAEAGRARLHHAREPSSGHDHVIIDLDGGRQLVFNDPRRFGLMTLATTADLAEHPLLAHLGIEPLGNELSADYLLAHLAGRRTSLKAALLDQTLIAGLGNIYVCEALYRARLSPRRSCASLGKVRAERLAAAIRSVLEEAVAAGGSSLKDYVHADGTLGYFQHHFAVYDREGQPCRRPACKGTLIKRIVQSGRSTFYCPSCQR